MKPLPSTFSFEGYAMRKIAKRFEDIWSKAEKYNRTNGHRYVKIYETRKRYITMGIYDTQTKKWSTFDTINLVGNFRFSPKEVPAELEYMDSIVESV